MANFFETDYLWMYNYKTGGITRQSDFNHNYEGHEAALDGFHIQAVMERVFHLEKKTARLELLAVNGISKEERE